MTEDLYTVQPGRFAMLPCSKCQQPVPTELPAEPTDVLPTPVCKSCQESAE
jgi:hypothetical protein